jgi:hypothetical protein
MNERLSMVAHVRNHSTWELRQEDQEFKVSLSYISETVSQRNKTTATVTTKKNG